MANAAEKGENWVKRLLGVVEKIGLKALATGNFGWFVLLVVAASIVWKLNSADLKDVLLKVTSTLGWLGYPVSAVTVYVSVAILRWREKFFQAEMQRMATVRNEAIQKSLELPLQSSVSKMESK